MNEKELEKWALSRAKSEGCELYKWTSPSVRGVSDRILVAPQGVVWFLEFKHPGKPVKLTPLQQNFKRRMESLGQNYAIINSKIGFENVLSAALQGKTPTTVSG